MITADTIRRARNGRAMLKLWKERQGKALDNDAVANQTDALSDLLAAIADAGTDPRDAIRRAMDHYEVENADKLQQFDERACAEVGLDDYSVRNGAVFWMTGGAGGVESYPGLALDSHGCAARGFYYYHGEAIQGPFSRKRDAERDRTVMNRTDPFPTKRAPSPAA